MSLLAAIAGLLFQSRPDMTHHHYLRLSTLLAPIAVIAVIADAPVSVLLSEALHEVVPANLIPALDTPPILEMRSQAACAWLVRTAALLVVGACTVIVVQEQFNLQETTRRAELLSGARVLATAWLLITAATQVGSLRQLGIDTRNSVAGHLPSSRSFAVAGITLLFGFALLLIARRWEGPHQALCTAWNLLRTPVHRILRGVATLAVSLCVAAIIAALWPLSYPLHRLLPLVAITPDSVLRAQIELEPDLPTGAVVAPLRGQL